VGNRSYGLTLKDMKLSRCGVCGTMEAVEWEHRDARFMELPGGIWVHRGIMSDPLG